MVKESGAAAAGSGAAAAGSGAAAAGSGAAKKRKQTTKTTASDGADDADADDTGELSAEDAPTPGRRPRLHDGSPATDGKCVLYTLKKAIELLATRSHAALITCTRLNKMIQLDLNQKRDAGHQKKDGSSWMLSDCGLPGKSWSENCILLLLKNLFVDDDDVSYFTWQKVRRAALFPPLKPPQASPSPDAPPNLARLKTSSYLDREPPIARARVRPCVQLSNSEFKQLIPSNEPNSEEELGAVYLVCVDLNETPGGIIDAVDDGDNKHMALLIPERDQVYCSYYYFPTMKKKELALPFTNELTPLVMTEQFAQNDTGQIAGDGVNGKRFKKIHRAYRLALKPGLPIAGHLKSSFDEAFGLGYGFKYQKDK